MDNKEIIDIIKLINDTFNNAIDSSNEKYEQTFSEETGKEAHDFFQTGGCYNYAEFLQRLIGGELYMRNDETHVALMIDEKLYDSNSDTENNFLYPSEYHAFEDEDYNVAELTLVDTANKERYKKMYDALFEEVNKSLNMAPKKH